MKIRNRSFSGSCGEKVLSSGCRIITGRYAKYFLLSAALFLVVFLHTDKAFATWSSDYRYWSQNQTAYSDRNIYAMADYGCPIVAQARMLYEMGVDRSANFNPDSYMLWEKQHGYISDLSHIEQLKWDGPTAYAAEKGFSVTTYSEGWDTSDTQLWYNIEHGYWTILMVSGYHYVLVDNQTSKQTGNLYIYESSSDGYYVGPYLLSSRNYTRNYSYVYVLNTPIPTNNLPIGHGDGIYSPGDGKLHLYGWALDPDTPDNNRIELDVYIGADGYSGGARYVTYTNSDYRPDVHKAYGYGNYHGFWMNINVNERGTQPVYIYAIDTSDPQKNTLIYSGTVKIKTTMGRLKLPANLKEIGDYAFEGLSSIDEVTVPSGVKRIGQKAFANCRNLTLVWLPDSVTEIASDAFSGSEDVFLLCETDNAAAAFARQYGIRYTWGDK